MPFQNEALELHLSPFWLAVLASQAIQAQPGERGMTSAGKESRNLLWPWTILLYFLDSSGEGPDRVALREKQASRNCHPRVREVTCAKKV